MGFFSALMATGKRTEHHDDPEAAKGSHDQQQHNKHDQSHPPKNFFAGIFGKPSTEHHEEAGVSLDEHHNKPDHESHPPKKNLFAGIFGEHHHEQGGVHVSHDQHNHQLHTPKHFFAKILHRIELFLRIVTLAFLVAGIVVLALNQAANITTSSNGNKVVSTLKFLHLASYKYIFAAIIISQTYITVQIVFSLCRLVTGIQRGLIIRYFDFIGDKILTYLLATGAAAAFGASIDMEISGDSSYLNQGKTAASLVLIAFFFSAISSVISSHSLPKHPCFL